MSEQTSIEWTDATWQPITGCSVVSPGCKNCYAMRLAGTRLRNHPSRAGLTRDSAAGPVWNGEVRRNPQWLDQPLRWTRPRRIFVCAHGDLFHESVPDEWIDEVFAMMMLARQHTFQVLTKRAGRMRRYINAPCRRDVVVWTAGQLVGEAIKRGDKAAVARHLDAWNARGADGVLWPLPNVWLGVSVEDQRRADERIHELLATLAAVRWLSIEPMLGPVDIQLAINRSMPWQIGGGDAGLHWIVAGGESGPGARPSHPRWFRDLRDRCTAAGVPYLFKQWGDWSPGYAEHGNDLCYETIVAARQYEWPEGHCSFHVGKRAAGRLLDGVLHDAYPGS